MHQGPPPPPRHGGSPGPQSFLQFRRCPPARPRGGPASGRALEKAVELVFLASHGGQQEASFIRSMVTQPREPREVGKPQPQAEPGASEGRPRGQCSSCPWNSWSDASGFRASPTRMSPWFRFCFCMIFFFFFFLMRLMFGWGIPRQHSLNSNFKVTEGSPGL